MPMERVESYFEREAFVHDVREYMKRWKLNITSTACLAGIDRNVLMRALSSREFEARGKTYRGKLTLYVVCRLAHLCDLDINKYVLPPFQNPKSFT